MKTRDSEARPNVSESRRLFLRQMGTIAGAGVIHSGMTAAQGRPTEADRNICEEKFTIAVREDLPARPIGEIMVAIGTSFLGTPYEAATLEREGPEQLVVNLRTLDCVTFVESTLALSRCIRARKMSFDEFTAALTRIRYRNGAINGYASRLHYFSDWIADNEAKHIVRNVTRDLGGVAWEKSTSFMSEHTASYRQLADTTVLSQIRDTEERLNGTERWFIPRKALVEKTGIESGDIIGITTAVEGLDIAHTGIAVRMNGVLRYLHAPLSGGSVQISPESFSRYLADRPKHTGVMVARPIDPAL